MRGAQAGQPLRMAMGLPHAGVLVLVCSPLQSLALAAMQWAPCRSAPDAACAVCLPAGITGDDLRTQLYAAWSDADEDEQHEFHEAYQAELAAAAAAADTAAAEGSTAAAPAGKAKATSKVRRFLRAADYRPSLLHALLSFVGFVCVTLVCCCCCCRERGEPKAALQSMTRCRWAGLIDRCNIPMSCMRTAYSRWA